MTPRPLHRWKSLWLGILVLIFLAWNWQRSIRYYDSASWAEASGARGISLSQRDSVVFVTWAPAKDPDTFSPGFHIFRARMSKRHYPTFPALFSGDPMGPNHPPPPFRAIYIPHWFLILLFLTPWSVFLAWRWRRIKRLTTPPPGPETISHSGALAD
ncbi:hypothetical protein [Luteolibacter soli]|uniref:DUF3592 domain-containing protein n=1 Tax=Luteolibacter soli TaxID=3135280 RepID=A0ABU9AV47_9BACT